MIINGHETGLKYVKNNREVMIAIPGSDFPIGTKALLLGKLFHTHGKWKGQFFLYHISIDGKEYGVTEEDFVLVTQ